MTDRRTSHERSIMPRSARSVSEAKALLMPLVGRVFKNVRLDLSGTLSINSIKKMASDDATTGSISPRLHALAVANADDLFENAEFDVPHPDRNRDRNFQMIHRLGAIMYDDRTIDHVPIMLTVKEFSDGSENKIYSIEAVDIHNKGRSTTGTAVRFDGSDSRSGQIQFADPDSPIMTFNNKIIDLLEKVNRECKKIKNI